MRENSMSEMFMYIAEIKDIMQSMQSAPTNNEIDWEARRYEIAKDILATSHIAQQIGKYGYNYEEEVKEAVRMADLLIAELKKKGE